MKKIVLLLFSCLFMSCSFSHGQIAISDPDNGVKLKIIISPVQGKAYGYSYFKEIKDSDFAQMMHIRLSNLGRKTDMDSEVLDKLFNEAPHLQGIWIEDGIRIDELPEIKKENQTLQFLEISYAHLQKLPESIGRFQALRSLYLIGNKLDQLPESFSQLKHLQNLKFGGNEFTSFPNEILSLTNLMHLGFNEPIHEFPEALSKLENLTQISFIGADLKELPSSVAELKNLRDIKLGKNGFTDFPKPLLKLEKLRTVDLSYNPISKENLEKSLQNLKTDQLYLASPLNEEDQDELEDKFSKIKFGGQVSQSY